MNQQYEDIYGNVFRIDRELSSGGQGIVYKTKEPDILLKIEWDPKTKRINVNTGDNDKFDEIRLLPVPPNVNITLPQSILKDCAGYSMKMLDHMISFEEAFRYGDENYRNAWLDESEASHPEFVKGFGNYISTGGKRRRIAAFLYVAGILSVIHTRGLVYCDLSDKNMYLSDSKDTNVVWMIDADNINYITVTSKRDGIYSPGYAAPEVLKGKGNTFYSDIFSFAVALFWNLTGRHPFVGPQLEEKLGEEDFLTVSEETFACGSDVAWIRDEKEDDNFSDTPIPYELIVGGKLHNCFQKTFGSTGRHKRQKRPTMIEWAEALAYEMDHSVKCKKCEMEYDPFHSDICPWCDEKNKYIQLTCRNQELEDDEDTRSYVHEMYGSINVPVRLVKGLGISELEECIFSITSVRGNAVIENLNCRYLYERNQDGFYQKIFGKCELGDKAVMKVTDQFTGEEYVVNYELKG